MNRAQGQICRELGPAKTKVLFPGFNLECFDIMCKWADGAEIEIYDDSQIEFCNPASRYSFKSETHIINNIKVPAPYRVEPKEGYNYWFTNCFGEIQTGIWTNSYADDRCFKIGNCFKSESDAKQNSKAHWRQS